jgi:hypothetical protein
MRVKMKWGIGMLSRSMETYKEKRIFTPLGVGTCGDLELLVFAFVRFVPLIVFCTIIVFIERILASDGFKLNRINFNFRQNE